MWVFCGNEAVAHLGVPLETPCYRLVMSSQGGRYPEATHAVTQGVHCGVIVWSLRDKVCDWHRCLMCRVKEL
jgi:hypothetical protein